MTRAHAAMLPDGRRLHLQDGPIDLVIEAFGPAEAVRAAYAAAIARFDGLLDELCAELPALRAPARPGRTALTGPVALRMHEAVAPHAAPSFSRVREKVPEGRMRARPAEPDGEAGTLSIVPPSAVPPLGVMPGLVPETHSFPRSPTPHLPDRRMGSRHKAGNDFGEGSADGHGDATGATRHPGSSPGPALLPPAAREGEATDAGLFITPMAAVAGAVADEILAAMIGAVAAGGESDGPEPGGRLSCRPPTHSPLYRAYVNNGGDIALFLAPGERFTIGLVDRPDRPSLDGALFARTELSAADGIGGIATSGWRGRSFSLGIADAVTVLARDAAAADAAATVIANAVDLPGHPAIVRVPAHDLQPDSDLGHRLVTRAVGALTADEIAAALAAGAAVAEVLVGRGLIAAAALHLAGATRVVGAPLARRIGDTGPRVAVGPAVLDAPAG